MAVTWCQPGAFSAKQILQLCVCIGGFGFPDLQSSVAGYYVMKGHYGITTSLKSSTGALANNSAYPTLAHHPTHCSASPPAMLQHATRRADDSAFSCLVRHHELLLLSRRTNRSWVFMLIRLSRQQHHSPLILAMHCLGGGRSAIRT